MSPRFYLQFNLFWNRLVIFFVVSEFHVSEELIGNFKAFFLGSSHIVHLVEAVIVFIAFFLVLLVLLVDTKPDVEERF